MTMPVTMWPTFVVKLFMFCLSLIGVAGAEWIYCAFAYLMFNSTPDTDVDAHTAVDIL